MKKMILVIALVAAMFAVASAEETRLLRYPDVHGDTIVFGYAGDLWTVSSDGGIARRLTTHIGLERSPKFSPDGKTIGFTGFYDGNTDVFILPAVGGEPRRLTFHPGNDEILDFYPDGKNIYFRSKRSSFSGRFSRLHTIPVDMLKDYKSPVPKMPTKYPVR